MDKLEHFVRIRTKQVEDSHFQYALRQFFDAAAQYYKKPEREDVYKRQTAYWSVLVTERLP